VTSDARRQPATSRPGRLLAALLLGVLGLALIAPTVAGAATARYQLSGDQLTARVVGGPRVGMWRVRIVAPGGEQRIDFVLSSTDLEWSALVRTSARTLTGWVATDRQRVRGSFAALAPASGEGAGVRWNSADFRLPRDGDGRFAVSVELTAGGSYRVVTAVRSAAEAFSYGPWQRVSTASVSH
jgi:hypothetical protein